MLHPMEARFAGVAPLGDKGAAIAAWQRVNAPEARLLIIDDDAELLGELRLIADVELLLCDPRRGLSDPAVQKAISDWLIEWTAADA